MIQDLDPTPAPTRTSSVSSSRWCSRTAPWRPRSARSPARHLFYARLPEVKGTAGAAALMSDEVLIGEPGYEWTLNHPIEARDPMELFRTRFATIDGSSIQEAA